MKEWIVITGPTASGKTDLAAHVAHRINGEVVSVDSRQVFRQMDIGSGKDREAYYIKDRQIPYHLIDIADPGEDYHVAAFQHDFQSVISDLNDRGITPVLCGGTGFYLEAVLEEHKLTAIPIDEKYRESLLAHSPAELKQLLSQGPSLPYSVDINSKKRMIRALEIQRFLELHQDFELSGEPNDARIFILNLPREIRRLRISERLSQRMSAGLLEEVAALRKKISDEKLIRYGLEYKWITFYLNGSMTYEDMYAKLETEIHRFSKRQMTWFRRLARKYPESQWLDATIDVEELSEIVMHRCGY